jgi:hypothetical protein
MKDVLTILIILLELHVAAQTNNSFVKYKGQLIDSTTLEGIEYVNIGIENTSVGTISKLYGDFELEIDTTQYADSTILISAIGYEPKKIKIFDFDTDIKHQIKLVPKIYKIGDVIIKSSKLKEENYGITNSGGGLIRGVLRGFEKAYLIPVKHDRILLKAVNFCISGKIDTIIFRINFYNHVDYVPNERIVEKNLIFELIQDENGWIKCDLSKEQLTFKSDFFISVELLPKLEDGTDKRPQFKAKIGGKGVLYSRDYFENWFEIKGLGVPINVDYFETKE